MSIGSQGENLIFMISQPRAGSTMFQRILGSHPDIHTVSEPWLMLHLPYALRSEGYEAEYNAHLAWLAVKSFLQTLPGGEDEYFEGIRRMGAYLYGRALMASGKRYFLDKTPRYYFIIPELYHIFPEAHYIILLRNPMAVRGSILNTWVKEDRSLLDKFKHDLNRAPRLLLDGIEMLGEQCIVVHYEQLIKDPENETRRICEGLGIDFAPEMIEYGDHDLPHWYFGDQGEVYQHARPVLQTADKWVLALDDPQEWWSADEYLEFLGEEIVEQMGYSYQELRQILEAHRPRSTRPRFRLPMSWPSRKSTKGPNRWMDGIVRLIRSLRQRGFRVTAAAVARKLVYVLSNRN